MTICKIYELELARLTTFALQSSRRLAGSSPHRVLDEAQSSRS
jgi:hypothetical protein